MFIMFWSRDSICLAKQLHGQNGAQQILNYLKYQFYWLQNGLLLYTPKTYRLETFFSLPRVDDVRLPLFLVNKIIQIVY